MSSSLRLANLDQRWRVLASRSRPESRRALPPPGSAIGVRLPCQFIRVGVTASSLFPRISLGSSSPLGAPGGTPGPPHLARSHRSVRTPRTELVKLIVAEDRYQTMRTGIEPEAATKPREAADQVLGNYGGLAAFVHFPRVDSPRSTTVVLILSRAILPRGSPKAFLVILQKEHSPPLEGVPQTGQPDTFPAPVKPA